MGSKLIIQTFFTNIYIYQSDYFFQSFNMKDFHRVSRSCSRSREAFEACQSDCIVWSAAWVCKPQIKMKTYKFLAFVNSKLKLISLLTFLVSSVTDCMKNVFIKISFTWNASYYVWVIMIDTALGMSNI